MCDALTAKSGKLEKELETLCDAHKANEKTIEGLESQAASDAKAIAHIATRVKEHRLNSLRVVAENGEWRRRVPEMDGKTFEAGSSAEQPQPKLTSMAKKRDTLAA